MGSLGRILRNVQKAIVIIMMVCCVLMAVCAFTVMFVYSHEPYSLVVSLVMLVVTIAASALTMALWKKNRLDIAALNKTSN